MSNASVASDFHQSFDIQIDFSSEITFHMILCIDNLSDLTYLFFRQISFTLVSGLISALDKISSFAVGLPMP